MVLGISPCNDMRDGQVQRVETRKQTEQIFENDLKDDLKDGVDEWCILRPDRSKISRIGLL